MNVRALTIAIAVAVVTACGGDKPAPAPEPPVVAQAPAEDSAPVESESSMQDPPAVSPGEESTTPAGTEDITGFHGFGPARFGDEEESVRISWGRPMSFDRELDEGEVCRYLMPDPEPAEGFSIAFMFEEDRFVRYDVRGEQYEAPGGGRIGNTRDALESLYRGRFELEPHKYVEGAHYFRVEGPEGSGTALVFELDEHGIATEWRVGVPPAVDYVEGCS